jgi:hypothetical protein
MTVIPCLTVREPFSVSPPVRRSLRSPIRLLPIRIGHQPSYYTTTDKAH